MESTSALDGWSIWVLKSERSGNIDVTELNVPREICELLPAFLLGMCLIPAVM